MPSSPLHSDILKYVIVQKKWVFEFLLEASVLGSNETQQVVLEHVWGQL